MEPFRVLYLCTGNSGRSIMAESLTTHWGGGNVIGYSAGSFPKGELNPIAVQLLEHMKLPTAGLRSKSWDEFAKDGAPVMDFVITVCDDAAGEICPVWPGHPVTAHWGVPDPSLVTGHESEKWAAFRDVFHTLERRIQAFLNLPLASLDRLKREEHAKLIGLS